MCADKAEYKKTAHHDEARLNVNVTLPVITQRREERNRRGHDEQSGALGKFLGKVREYGQAKDDNGAPADTHGSHDQTGDRPDQDERDHIYILAITALG